MPFEQVRFLGASIRGFNANLGWDESPSVFTVSLVEDIRNGDEFTEPDVGSPVYFEYGDWSFNGIVQNWERGNSESGNPTYEVVIIDPREILDGVQLILAGYTGEITIPNVLNIFGYLERDRFGDSGRTSAGIPLVNVVAALTEMTLGVGTGYGGYINVLGYNYSLDLTSLPIPGYYRLTNKYMSVLELIREVCDATNHSFYFRLNGTFITLGVVNRNLQPSFGAIDRFVSDTLGAKTKKAGFEFAQEFTSKFLVGGRKTRMYFQFPTGGDDGDFSTLPEQNTIWPYWGLKDKNAIIGNGLRDDHTFEVDIRRLDIKELGNNYKLDVGEIRAALDSQDAWEGYLALRNNNEFKIAPRGTIRANFKDGNRPHHKLIKLKYSGPGTGIFENITYTDIDVSTSPIFASGIRANDELPDDDIHKRTIEKVDVQYTHSGVLNPHFGKASILGCEVTKFKRFTGAFLVNQIASGNFDISIDSIKATTNIVNKSPDLDPKPRTTYINPDTGEILDSALVEFEFERERRSKVYNMVLDYGMTYYGKQFMVRLPFVESTLDGETNVISTNYETSDLAFINEDEFEFASQRNLIPIQFIDGDADKGLIIDPHLMEEDGRIHAYVRFDTLSANYSEISEEDIIVTDFPRDITIQGKRYRFPNSIFIRCEVEPFLVYEDRELLYGPRAVIKLPGRVTFQPTTKDESYGFHIVGNFLFPLLRNKLNTDSDTTGLSQEEIDDLDKQIDEEAKKKTNKVIKEQVGSDVLNLWSRRYALNPNLACIPLLTQDRYGPWVSQGISCKTIFDQDDNLVPWNFNSWTELNNAALSKIQEAISNYQVAETGSIEVPGAPTVLLGAPLIENGPFVTNINVSVNEGVTTTYSMATWKPNPYKLGKQKQDYLRRVGLKQRELFRENILRTQQKTAARAGQVKVLNEIAKMKAPVKEQPHTSHDVIFGQRTNDDYQVVFQPYYNVIDQLIQGSGKEYQSAASLNNIFFPYSISASQSGNLPSIENPTGSGVNSRLLNPYKRGYNPASILTSNSIEQGILRPNIAGDQYNWDSVRSVGFRGPLVMTGWGVNDVGQPVPNSGNVEITTSSLLINPAYDAEDPTSEQFMVVYGSYASGDGPNQFSEIYLKPDYWKTGPIDLRWSDRRKVWGSSTHSCICRVVEYRPPTEAYSEQVPGEFTGPDGDIPVMVTKFREVQWPHLVRCQKYSFNFNPNHNLQQNSGVFFASGELQMADISTIVAVLPDPFLFNALNFRVNPPKMTNFYMAHEIDGQWIIDIPAEDPELNNEAIILEQYGWFFGQPFNLVSALAVIGDYSDYYGQPNRTFPGGIPEEDDSDDF